MPTVWSASAADVPGQLAVRVRPPGDSERVFAPDGTVRTGDLGYVDEDGYLYIRGRADDVIVLDNGRKVIVSPLEEFLRASPAIEEAVSSARPDPPGRRRLPRHGTRRTGRDRRPARPCKRGPPGTSRLKEVVVAQSGSDRQWHADLPVQATPAADTASLPDQINGG